jgi:hypothetical protein
MAELPLPSDEEMVEATGIIPVSYIDSSLVEWFEEHKPLGLCNGCIIKAKAAESNGDPPHRLNAAIALISSTQNVTINVPGAGPQTMPVVLALGSCWTCMRSTKFSPLGGSY